LYISTNIDFISFLNIKKLQIEISTAIKCFAFSTNCVIILVSSSVYTVRRLITYIILGEL